ncbi:MAG: D-glycero-beta-D-manno-heptose-7-phosphate kinase [Deltaproteobacteria bacterium]|nr:D-glycero-beta-D-manno-heptose-7-phosphate kinase [Deltaproteobacteria bacterium]
MTFSFDENRFDKCQVFVIGDIMLDCYLWGDVSRISPEAPVPVFHIKSRSEVLGGAGNVLSNLLGLGCQITLLGILGKDEAGDRVTALLQNDLIPNLCITSAHQPTITKTRIVSIGQQLIRLDDEKVAMLDDEAAKSILAAINTHLADADAVLLSDYGKGLLQTPGISQEIIRMAKESGKPVFVDPKGKDWRRYQGATCITPNSKEMEQLAGVSLENRKTLRTEMVRVIETYGLQWLLVTQGAAGMTLAGRNWETVDIAANARQVYDVSGAGDTVIATLAAGVASGMAFPDAARLANAAAGIVVGKVGTQPINLVELKGAMGSDGTVMAGNYVSKVASWSAASLQVEAWRAAGRKIVFTNGCFDLLHPGHVHLLNLAKDLGHRLVVGLNSDSSVSRLKGPERPILDERDRASMLGSLDCVDLVVIFDDDTPERLIQQLKPDILAKGTDYRTDQVVGREIVESYGGQVRLLPLLDGYSTTAITKRVFATSSNASESCIP